MTTSTSSQARTLVAFFAATLTLALATALGATETSVRATSDEPAQSETITAGRRSP